MEYTVAFVLASMAMMVQGCTVDFAPGVARQADGWETDEMKVHFSDVVVFGTVKKIADSTKPGMKHVTFDVHCSYKGDIRTKTIHITAAGKGARNTVCPKIAVPRGQHVAMFLKRVPGKSGSFEMEFTPSSGQAHVFMDDLSLVCGLDLTMGGELTGHSDCYEPLTEEEECVKYELPTTTQAPVTTTTVNATAKTIIVEPPNPEPEDSEEDKNDSMDKDGKDDTYNTKTETPGKDIDKEKTEGSKGGSTCVSVSAFLVLLFSLIATLI